MLSAGCRASCQANSASNKLQQSDGYGWEWMMMMMGSLYAAWEEEVRVRGKKKNSGWQIGGGGKRGPKASAVLTLHLKDNVWSYFRSWWNKYSSEIESSSSKWGERQRHFCSRSIKRDAHAHVMMRFVAVLSSQTQCGLFFFEIHFTGNNWFYLWVIFTASHSSALGCLHVPHLLMRPGIRALWGLSICCRTPCFWFF